MAAFYRRLKAAINCRRATFDVLLENRSVPIYALENRSVPIYALVVKVALPANGGILQKAQGSHKLQACYFRRIAGK
jgi:hypothetical protein